MPQFNSYESEGRTLMVKFTCRRCGKEQIDPLEAHKDDDRESYGYLRYIKVPTGWCDHLINGSLLCPECVEALRCFMRIRKEGNTWP